MARQPLGWQKTKKNATYKKVALEKMRRERNNTGR